MASTPNLRLIDSGVRLTWAETVEEFLADRKLQNYSPNTLVWYRSVFGPFGRFLQESGAPDDLARVTEGVVRDFLMRMQSEGAKGKPVGPRWLNNCRQALKSFFEWAKDKGYTAHNPVAGIGKVKEPESVIEPFTSEQIQALVAEPDTRTVNGQRDRLFFLMLFDAGLRLAEALDLEVKDIDLETGEIRNLLGKGKKRRTVGLSAGVVSELRTYLRFRQQALEDIGCGGSPWLFPNIKGGRLCSKTMQQATRRYGIAAGIDPERVRLSPHTLRHTFAVSFLRNGGQEFVLQQALGHSTLDTTRRYVKLATSDVVRAMHDFSPVAALGLASVGGRRMRRAAPAKRRVNAAARVESSVPS